MLTKRRTAAGIPDIGIWAYLTSDGTDGLPGQGAARDRAEAEQYWPFYRRRVWAHAHVGRVPRAAKVFDALQTDGHDTLWSTWQHQRFDLDAVLRALDADRAAVRAFQLRDADGAREIADYLLLFLNALERVEHEAVRIGASTEVYWNRGTPQTSSGRRYGTR